MEDLFKCIINKFKVRNSIQWKKFTGFILAAIQNRNNQQPGVNNTMTFSNPPQQQQANPVSVINPMVAQSARFPPGQPTPRMGTTVNPTSLREPPKFNPSKFIHRSFLFYLCLVPIAAVTTTIVPSFSQSSSTPMDVSQVYPSQRMNNPNSTDYSALQPRFPNPPRQRLPIPITQISNPPSGDQCISIFFSFPIQIHLL